MAHPVDNISPVGSATSTSSRRTSPSASDSSGSVRPYVLSDSVHSIDTAGTAGTTGTAGIAGTAGTAGTVGRVGRRGSVHPIVAGRPIGAIQSDVSLDSTSSSASDSSGSVRPYVLSDSDHSIDTAGIAGTSGTAGTVGRVGRRGSVHPIVAGRPIGAAQSDISLDSAQSSVQAAHSVIQPVLQSGRTAQPFKPADLANASPHGSQSSNSSDEEKQPHVVHVTSRLQAIRIGMKRALTATSLLSTFTNATTTDEELKPTISHPLHGVSRKRLYQKVLELAQDCDLMDDADILKRGARVAQKNKNWRELGDELSEEDYAMLQKVEAQPWCQVTWPLLLTVAAASFGALTLGWDQGVVSGATLHYPKMMNIDPDVAGPHQVYYNWLTGLVSAGPFLGAAGVSVWLSDTVNHYTGRKGCLYLASVFLLACPIASAFTNNWKQLFVCRILLGVGIGFLEVTAPVFAAESAPAEIRGAMTINFQLFTVLGILLGESSSLLFENVTHNWRFMLGSPMVPVPILLVLLSQCPESARWYLKWGKVKPAFLSLKKLRHNDLLAARDLYLIHTQMVEEQIAIGGSRNVKRFAELFYKNRVRQSTVASCISHLAQVLSGVNIVSMFSSTIFTEITQHYGDGGTSSTALVGQHTPSNRQALWGSWGFGIVSLVFTIPALWSIDKVGRRVSMLATLPNLFWTLLCTGLCFLINSKGGSGVELGLVLTFIYLFTAFYSIGMGPIAFCYSAESAAQTHRELSVALAAFVNNGANAILSITFFRMRQVFTTVGVFGFFAGLNVVMLLLVFALVPETKQLSLEELDSVFAHSNREFMHYQFTRVLPFWWKRYILQHKNVTLLPLDDLNHIVHL